MEEKFVVVSLEGEKSKKVANILSNNSCRKILDMLSETRMSVSELSKKMDVPISTIHYNIEQLKDAGFVKESAFRYSEKGKKVLYYEPERKIIILAPKGEERNILNRLKIFAVPILLGVGSVLSGVFSKERVTNAGIEKSFDGAQATLASAPAASVSDIISSSMFSYYPELLFVSGLLAGLALLSLIVLVRRYRDGKM